MDDRLFEIGIVLLNSARVKNIALRFIKLQFEKFSMLLKGSDASREKEKETSVVEGLLYLKHFYLIFL
jgi:hypothetical protein